MTVAPRTWRNFSIYFADVGRCIERIELGLRHVAATAAITDTQCKEDLQEMSTAAKRLVRAIDAIIYSAKDG